MNGRLAVAIAAGLALGGCCLDGNGCVVPPTTALASWDGLGLLPKPAKVKRAKRAPKTSVAVATSEDKSPGEEELSKLRPYSREWSVVLDAINRADDDKLRKKLIICRNCMPPEAEDRTGSIAARREAGGYLPFRE